MGALSLKPTLQRIGSSVALRPSVGTISLGANQGLQAQLLHQPLDGLVVDCLSCLPQGGGDAPVAITPFVAVVDRPDTRLQRRVPIVSAPGMDLVVERAARQLSRTQQQSQRMFMP
jgi:hypothetical protein